MEAYLNILSLIRPEIVRIIILKLQSFKGDLNDEAIYIEVKRAFIFQLTVTLS